MALAAAGAGAWIAANAGTIAAVSAAASVAAAGYQAYSANQSASAQEDYQKQMNEAKAQSAVDQYGQLNAAERDTINNANDEILNQKSGELAAKGRVNVFSAASGMGGNSINSLLGDIETTNGQNINKILNDRQAGLYNVTQQAYGLQQGAVANQDLSAITRPSWLEGGLNVANAAANGLGNYNKATKVSDQLQPRNSIKGGQ